MARFKKKISLCNVSNSTCVVIDVFVKALFTFYRYPMLWSLLPWPQAVIVTCSFVNAHSSHPTPGFFSDKFLFCLNVILLAPLTPPNGVGALLWWGLLLSSPFFQTHTFLTLLPQMESVPYCGGVFCSSPFLPDTHLPHSLPYPLISPVIAHFQQSRTYVSPSDILHSLDSI